MEFVWLGRITFPDALETQQRTVRRIAVGESPETVHLLEHPHVFTSGRQGKESNLLAARDHQGHPIRLIRTNRGGDVTYHGPGQLVGYPHIDLRQRSRDIHAYLRSLEQALIDTAANFGVKAFRRQGLTGVWTAQGKLASIGVGVRRWVTMHGFALNVCTDLRYFNLINPCGIAACPVTSLSALQGRAISINEVRTVVEDALRRRVGQAAAVPAASRS